MHRASYSNISLVIFMWCITIYHEAPLYDWLLVVYVVNAVVCILESILGQLLSIVKDETVPNEVSQLAFQLLYLITKVITIFYSNG